MILFLILVRPLLFAVSAHLCREALENKGFRDAGRGPQCKSPAFCQAVCNMNKLITGCK